MEWGAAATEVEVGAAVEVAVAYGLGYVAGLNAVGAGKVGNGARHFQYSVVGACAHVHALDGVFKPFEPGGVGFGKAVICALQCVPGQSANRLA